MTRLALPECAFTPPLWARGGHAQTVLGHLFPGDELDLTPATAHAIDLADGEQLLAHHLAGESDVLVLFFHGLGGDATSSYMLSAAAAARALGHGVLLVNHRGCGTGCSPVRRPTHAGLYSDLSAAVDRARRLAPEKRLVAVGFSLSGNLVLNLVAAADATQPDAAIAVNPPCDLDQAANAIGSGLGRIYGMYFLRRCRRWARVHKRAGLLEWDEEMPLFGTLRDFDERFTAKVSGFDDAAHYYRESSSLPRLDRVQKPTVLLTSRDDPFIDPEPLMQRALSPLVHLHVVRGGGHMGYVSRGPTPLGNRRWLDYALTHYLQALCEL